jgi:hypothetical protein
MLHTHIYTTLLRRTSGHIPNGAISDKKEALDTAVVSYCAILVSHSGVSQD